jgi:hypothetical protein
MAETVKAIALRPLNGGAIGDEIELSQIDFKRLSDRGVVKAARATESKDKKAAPENKGK